MLIISEIQKCLTTETLGHGEFKNSVSPWFSCSKEIRFHEGWKVSYDCIR